MKRCCWCVFNIVSLIGTTYFEWRKRKKYRVGNNEQSIGAYSNRYYFILHTQAIHIYGIWYANAIHLSKAIEQSRQSRSLYVVQHYLGGIYWRFKHMWIIQWLASQLTVLYAEMSFEQSLNTLNWWKKWDVDVSHFDYFIYYYWNFKLMQN